MANDLRERITTLLENVDGSDEPVGAAPEELVETVYDELRRLARSYLRRERAGHTLEATGLVHEAWLRLADQDRVSWRGRGHFFAVGAKMMRRLLVDHARRRGSAKRGGDWQRVTLAGVGLGGGKLDAGELDAEELLALDRALERLAELDPRQARVVELRYFAGLAMAEVAEHLGVSKRTVEGDWTHARAWLRRALEEGMTP